MPNTPSIEQNRSITPRKTHLTIAVLTTENIVRYLPLNWLGPLDAAQKYTVNLFSFIGGPLQTPEGFLAQAAVTFDLVNPDHFDGLIIWAEAVGPFLAEEELRNFCQRYTSIPIVTIERAFEGIPAILMDNYQSMREAMIHLIETHGYRRIAFIRGPVHHLGAQERYQAYVDTLAEYDIPFDPKLVSPPCEKWDGDVKTELLLNERQVDFEAVATAADHLTIGALRVLRSRGISVPDDIALIGYDDCIEGQTVTPPLTTLRAPFYEMGRQAVERLLALIDGQKVPEKVLVPSELVLRQSCGCLPSAVVEAAAERMPAETTAADKAALSGWRDELLSEMLQAGDRHLAKPSQDWIGQFLDSFMAALKTGSTNNFVQALDRILFKATAESGELSAWQNMVSALRRHLLPRLRGEMLMRSENLWQQARVAIGEMARRVEANQRVQDKQQTQTLREIGQALITTFDVDELMDVLTQGLSRLGIPRAYLALYEDPQNPLGLAKLILAYDENRPVQVAPDQLRFPSQHIVPEGLLPHDDACCMVVEPFYFREDQLGFGVFEVGPRDVDVYVALRSEISSALQGALLVQRLQQRSAELARQRYILETFMANVPDSIYFKDRDSRILQINQSIAARFGFEHPDEAIGKTDFDLFPAEQARLKYEAEQEIIRTGQAILALEEPDAGGRWALTTKMPLRNEYGEIIGTFGISRDITDLRQAQQGLEDAYTEIHILNDHLKDENLRMQMEMELAQQIQTSLLPMELKNIHPDFDIAALMLPAEEVGGDYYDIVYDLNHHLWFSIGDVSGHGVTPGLIMMMAQTIHTSMISNDKVSPKDVVIGLNKVLYHNIKNRLNTDHFMTFTSLKYLGKGRFQHAGSHLALVVYRKQKQQCELIDTNGAFLSFIPDIAHATENAEFSLELGDLLVLYTDGLTEAMNAQGKFLEIQGFQEIVVRHADKDIDIVKDLILRDVLAWCNGKREDDMSLVVIRRVR